MYKTTYQTVKLGRGKHPSPEHGACVMELASMLAGEPFSDHPKSVSAPIASFLRTYNDMVDDDRRQDLYEYAARCVGTVASAHVEQLRAQRLVEWAEAASRRRWPASVLHRFKRRRVEGRDPAAAARYAIQAIRRLSDATHQAVLALLDELISIGSADAPVDATALPPLARPVAPVGSHVDRG